MILAEASVPGDLEQRSPGTDAEASVPGDLELPALPPARLRMPCPETASLCPCRPTFQTATTPAGMGLGESPRSRKR